MKKKSRFSEGFFKDENHNLIDEIINFLDFGKDFSGYVYLFSPGRARGFRKIRILDKPDHKTVVYLPIGEKRWIKQKTIFFPVITKLSPFRTLWQKYMEEYKKGKITEFHIDYFREKLYEKAKECLK